jgi:tetratricopeptide (TPR) repeat protein
LSERSDPRSEKASETALNLGLELARKGQFEQALTAFSRAIEQNHRCWKAHRYRGITYAKLGRHDLAVADLGNAVRGDPQCAACLFERATARIFLGQPESALEDLSQCLEINQDFAPAYSSRAGIYSSMGDYHQALADISAALALRPDNADYLHNRAVVLTALQRYDEAIEAYLRVIELNPRSGGSYNNLGWLFATARDPGYRDCRKALLYARKALTFGRNGSWMDTLAAAYAECGDFEKAVSAEIEAYRLSRSNDNFRQRIEMYKRCHTYAQGRPQEGKR